MHEKIILSKAGRIDFEVENFVESIVQSLDSTFQTAPDPELVPEVKIKVGGFYLDEEELTYKLSFSISVDDQLIFSKDFKSAFRAEDREVFEEEVGLYFLKYVQTELMVRFILGK